MSIRNLQSILFTKRWYLLGGVLLALVLIAILGDFGKSVGDPASPHGSETGAGASDGGGAGAPPMTDSGAAEAPRATRSSLKRVAPVLDRDARQFPQVQQILADASLSEHEAAEALFGICQRSELPEAERDDALAHGLNLNFKRFGVLATDPLLLLPLAQRYFDELANRNDLPQEQIEGYLGLMSHSDEGMRVQATQQLAFLLESEALAETPEELRRVALERIEILKAAPPTSKAAADGE
jgi:hypothetical protein